MRGEREGEGEERGDKDTHQMNMYTCYRLVSNFGGG